VTLTLMGRTIPFPSVEKVIEGFKEKSITDRMIGRRLGRRSGRRADQAVSAEHADRWTTARVLLLETAVGNGSGGAGADRPRRGGRAG
jgi:hypothetical protein